MAGEANRDIDVSITVLVYGHYASLKLFDNGVVPKYSSCLVTAKGLWLYRDGPAPPDIKTILLAYLDRHISEAVENRLKA